MTLVDGSRGDVGYGGLLGYVRLPLEVAELFDESSVMRWAAEPFWGILAEKKSIGR